jgi:hypothetical protein
MSYALSQEEQMREIARKNAIRRSGYKFITLVLRDFSKRGVCGIEEAVATGSIDSRTGQETYSISIRGGAMRFEWSAEHGGEPAYQLLDSPHNRAFLASHYAGQHWTIEDPAVEAEIKKQYEDMASQSIPEQSGIEFVPDRPAAERLGGGDISSLLPESRLATDEIETLDDSEFQDLQARMKQEADRRAELTKIPVRLPPEAPAAQNAPAQPPEGDDDMVTLGESEAPDAELPPAEEGPTGPAEHAAGIDEQIPIDEEPAAETAAEEAPAAPARPARATAKSRGKGKVKVSASSLT